LSVDQERDLIGFLQPPAIAPRLQNAIESHGDFLPESKSALART
jgi:hypothetical protein